MVADPLVQDLVREKLHRLTVADFERMAQNGILTEDTPVELIDGALIDRAPIGSAHADCVDRLARMLFEQTSRDFRVRVQNPLVLGSHTEVQPDLAVVGPRGLSYADAHPGPEDVLLVIEVADTSAHFDRVVKMRLYAQHGIPEVWLVDVASRTFEIRTEPSSSGYRKVLRVESQQTITPQRIPSISVNPSDLF